MACTVPAYKICPSATGPIRAATGPIRGKDLCLHIQADTIAEDTTITRERDIDALTNNVRSLEAQVDLLTKEIRDLRGTETNVVTTVNNEVSAKHTNNSTTDSTISSYSESDYSSKPPGWIHPPDGWEWIGAKQEYKQKMTGIRICYRPTYNEWGVFFPPNFITMNDFIAESLSHAFENYASYK
jgi:hypothetical protein